MRILYVVPRYGPLATGGAEGACRSFATRMAARGHHVEVVTSSATSYLDWTDTLTPGAAIEDGVLVHRLPSAGGRDVQRFSEVSLRALTGRHPAPSHVQHAWLAEQGPRLDGLSELLRAQAGDFDAAVVLPYLYLPAFCAVTALAGRVPLVFHPCAHDEPPLRLPLYERIFRLPDVLGFFTEEEAAVVRRRFSIDRPWAVTGIGVEVDLPPSTPYEVDGLGDRPYLVCVGRIDPGKGTPELIEWFGRYKDAHPGPLALLLVGDPANEVEEHPDVFLTGVVGESARQALVEGSIALVHPSRYESFSLVLMEAWASSKAAIVNAASPVLAGHARRSGGALPYRDEVELGVVLDMLTAQPALQTRLGEAGRQYVLDHFRWDAVLERHESLLGQAVSCFRSPPPQR
ncbi:MAG TPA: glycosyltransferase family 4 protein [Acidimicrobiales bacterium]|nr:glycosyltransferase family 4 protein [Acidimicrobiales bacterium]